MSSINNVNLIGRLTRDPEKKGNSETKVAAFSLAVDNFRDKDNAHFFDCSAFGKNAENLIKYASKGRLVSVAGELNYERWTGKDGKPRNAVKVVVNSFQLLESKKSEANGAQQEPAAAGW